MKLEQRLDTGSQQSEIVRIVDGWYEIEEDGFRRPMPVLHFHGRSETGEYRHFAVDDFRPYFYVASDDVTEETLEGLDADRRVIRLEAADREGIGRGEPSIELIKVVVEKPWHVRDLREVFDRTWEADIQFVQRFLIDCDEDQPVTSLVEVPSGETMLSTSDVTAVDPDGNVDMPELRVATWDIEVYNEGEMPSTEQTRQPITGVAIHDSYADSMEMFALRSDADGWDEVNEIDDDVVYVYDDEEEMLSDVIYWFAENQPDVLVGWNNDSFDVPYFVNRCFELELFRVEQLSPTGNVDECDPDGWYINSDVNGIHIFDLLAAYKKSQYTELKSYKLEDVAAAETDLEKLDVDEQEAWREDPVSFCEYNIRDVRATVAINDEVNIL